MRIKWYILSFVLSLTMLGVVQQYQNPSPNQELVIQFNNAQLSESNTETSLAEISEALAQIGASHIEITSNENGFFRISYHSDEAVNDLKQILSEKIEVVFNHTSNKKNTPKTADYNLDIFQIESGNSLSWDFEAQEVEVLNLKSDRSFNPEVFKSSLLIETKSLQTNFKIAYNASKLVVFVADNTSHNTPETRAGPLC